jgi:hypothetical protein
VSVILPGPASVSVCLGRTEVFEGCYELVFLAGTGASSRQYAGACAGCGPLGPASTREARGAVGERSDSSALHCAKDSGADAVLAWYW